jgi:hypothetical protein
MTQQLQLFELGDFDLRDGGICLDCDVNTVETGEYYSLRDDVWLKANPAGAGMLCIGCVETRLGRRLASRDFDGALINHITLAQSERLRARLRNVPCNANSPVKGITFGCHVSVTTPGATPHQQRSRVTPIGNRGTSDA